MDTSTKESPARTARPEQATIRALKTELKSLQSQKNTVARQFKDADLTALQRTDLKHTMRQVSEAVNGTQAKLKALLNQAPQISKPRPLPAQFTVPGKQLNAPVEVRVLRTAEYSEWARFVAQHQYASTYHSPVYLSLIATQHHHSSLILAAYHRGELVGGLPITLLRSKLFGAFGVSLPYFNYGGPLSEFQDVTITLLNQATTLLDSEAVQHLEIRTVVPDLPFPVSQKKVSMVLTLPKDERTLDRQLGAKVRAQYNRTMDYQPTIRFGGVELLDEFYQVFATNMRDLGTPVYSKDWFHALLSEQQIQSTLVVGYLNNKPVSTGFLIGHHNTLEIPWASTLRKVKASNMNMWLYRQILGFAVRSGYAFFDFGRSTKGGGTYQFKKQWGADAIQHHWYYLAATNTHAREIHPDSPKYRLLIAVWQRLPIWFTKIVGPRVVKNLP